ncbi:hypothetical protein BH20CHL5_BH20CHL5_03320 [soil metagenome]
MKLRLLVAVAVAISGISGLTAVSPASQARAAQGTYQNPLDISSEVGPVENCADPTVSKGRNANGKWRWYMYCTKDPRNDEDRQSGNPGEYEFQLIPTYSSKDLVNWTYRGNVFDAENYPDWVEPDAGLFAPEIKRMNGQWYLYYTVTNVTDETSGDAGCGFDPAIGVATAPTPTGPWTDSGDPVVDPRSNGGFCNFFWTFDPDVVTTGGQRYMFFGSYYGGVFVRELAQDGLETDTASQIRISTGNKYEGPEVIRRNGYWYMFLSATNCCNGPLTGYSVYAGRSENITGPYVDRDGVSLTDDDTNDADATDGRIGGNPVLTMNGNRWVGTGHNTVFKDFSGRFWTIYHAVDKNDPYFADRVGFTKRPALIDPIAWVKGWPEVRAGRWASDEQMPAPAAQPGDRDLYRPLSDFRSRPGELIEELSSEFDGDSLDPQFSWVREPDPSTYEVSGGSFRFDTQAADLFVDSNNASVLIQDVPGGEWAVEARVRLTVPPEGCCFNFTQGGVVIYDGDDQYLKLTHTSIFETRQTEWAKEVEAGDTPAGYPRYGNTVVGPPGEWTTLRIIKADFGGGEYYQAWTKRDGDRWNKGGTYRYDELGDDAKIGLVSMGGSGYVTEVDWLRVYRLDERGPKRIIER